MKRLVLLLLITFIVFPACTDDDDISPNNSNFKQEMREFVIGISKYSKAINSSFYIIPQNGLELVSKLGEENGQPDARYLSAIDGNGQEDLYYGYENDDQATPQNTNLYLKSFLDISKSEGNKILATDYCSDPSKMDDSYLKNNSSGYVSFSANHRELDNIPNYPNPIFSGNDNHITTLHDIQNFLYLINPENYNTKANFINAITSTNYDLLIMDLFFHDGIEFTSTEINQLKSKANGGSRLVIAYMSIGEAENYRYYWNNDWNNNKPTWLGSENPDWVGNFKVEYWDKEWQSIIFGNDDSYLKKILTANFDGVYLDIIDAFEYYED